VDIDVLPLTGKGCPVVQAEWKSGGAGGLDLSVFGYVAQAIVISSV